MRNDDEALVEIESAMAILVESVQLCTTVADHIACILRRRYESNHLDTDMKESICASISSYLAQENALVVDTFNEIASIHGKENEQPAYEPVSEDELLMIERELLADLQGKPITSEEAEAALPGPFEEYGRSAMINNLWNENCRESDSSF